MTRLKAIIESTQVVESATAVVEREALAISQAKTNIRRVIESLEHNFGVDRAWPITSKLAAAMDAADVPMARK